jgi:hypothetical protein
MVSPAAEMRLYNAFIPDDSERDRVALQEGYSEALKHTAEIITYAGYSTLFDTLRQVKYALWQVWR